MTECHLFKYNKLFLSMTERTNKYKIFELFVYCHDRIGYANMSMLIVNSDEIILEHSRLYCI